MMNSILSLTDFSIGYEKSNELVTNLSFALPKSSILTILGRNGRGKTTLLNCLLGFNKGFKGQIYLLGRPIGTYTRKELARKIAYVPQLTDVQFDFTVEEFVLMGCSPQLGMFSLPSKKNMEDVLTILHTLSLYHLKDRNIRTLSGGEKQLAYIARALVQHPDLIVLDEPTSALDFAKTFEIIELLKSFHSRGYTVIMTTHNPDCPFLLGGFVIGIMRGGKHISGMVETVLSDNTLSEIYETSIKRIHIPEYNRDICIST